VYSSSSFWGSDSVRVSFDGSGNFLWMDGILEDISEQKELEYTFLADNEKYSAFLNYFPFAVFLTDEEGIIRVVNSKNSELAQCDCKEIIGKNVFEFINSEKRTKISDKTLQMPVGKIISRELDLLRFDGSSFRAEVWFAKLRLQDDKLGFIGIARELPN